MSGSATSSDFAAVGKRVSAWTTKLLATAIVLAGGLALGWQIIGWWHEESAATSVDASVTAGLPDLTAGQEFMTRSGALKIERIRGDASQALAAMEQFCRTITPTVLSRPADEAETRFVAELAERSPLKEMGEVALYQPRGQKSMVVAVSQSSKRIVGWSFALPVKEGVWSVYHFQPAHAAERSP